MRRKYVADEKGVELFDIGYVAREESVTVSDQMVVYKGKR